MMPGSLLTYVIRKALSNGAKAGLIVVLGHGILEASLVTLIFLGFDRLLKSDTAQIVIGITGGLLLCLMGIKMAVDAYRNKVKVEVGSGKAEGGSMVLSSIVLSAANPYFLLWWAIIGLGFIMQAHASFGYPGVIIYYCGHISADLAWYSLVSFVVGKTRKFIKEKPYRIIIAILGCLLVFFGVRFIYDAAEKLIKII